MATDVDVQYFSHLNGLALGNNWGDLIRLLDKTLVTGIAFTEITAASIDEQGDVHITLYSAHNAMLFQIVELSGFTPSSLNQKYRIKGTPSATELILKPSTAIAEKSVITKGAGKLASLGYEIIFRDQNDVKRVYRAKNPRAEHPFIRVDESLTSPDGTSGIYTSSYAKYAMVGLLENMTHIDDYENPEVLQLPFDSVDPVKNWKITGTSTNVVRGWSRWYWAAARLVSDSSIADSAQPGNGNRQFNLVGDPDAFYLLVPPSNDIAHNICLGAGIFNSAVSSSIIHPWFLATALTLNSANTPFDFTACQGCTPFIRDTIASNRVSDVIPVLNFNELNPLSNHVNASYLTPDPYSGRTNLFPSGTISALEVPIISNNRLRGTLKHILYSGKFIDTFNQVLSDNSMYLQAKIGARRTSGESCGYYFYIGELE
ncbi:hypothetical protein A7P53_00105 [Acinetobacter defluvii]|uniref:hypothetical protein n=1 Tax=Acinetobacter defluvii TaxID=1871111 RepID=UPI00148F4B92|nr:hypothetical protein [Acinetobacter defluvii]NNP71295.1 hypothetical protein [Acinetobacter defluvii]